MSQFSHADSAERYARSRPYFHTLVVDRIATFLELREPVATALDVACGTGLSSVALRGIASKVIGTDSSAEMLARAPQVEGIEYIEAPAEQLPFDDATFDLVTVSSAFHWFDRVRFFAEVRRVLGPAGWLIIYDNAFRGEMKENPGFKLWFQESYLARYPSPPRDRRPFGEEDAMRHGFHFLGREDYQNEVRFSIEELASYLETQSNVITAVEEGSENIEEVHRWLLNVLSSLFPGTTATFIFGGYIWHLRRSVS